MTAVDLHEEEQPRQHEIGHRTYVVADVEPLDVDGVRTTEIGTALWLIAFLALLPFYSTLQANGRLWWLWTCTAGLGLGLFGLEYCRRRRRARDERPEGTERTGGTGGTELPGQPGAPQPGQPEQSGAPARPAGGRRRKH